MNQALLLSKKAVTQNEVPVGCVIVNNKTKKIESEAHNETNLSRNGTRHCEIVALEKLIKKLTQDCKSLSSKGYALGNISDMYMGDKQINKFGTSYDLFVTVEPCIMCIGFIDKLGIKNIIFGCKNDRFGGCGSVLSYHKLVKTTGISIVSGVCENEAIKLLRDFYESGNPKAPENKRKRPLRGSN
ncbi:putative CMP/dCMP deaminase, zinc-binding [Cryptosporidium felis]|nr:putative CMP/dCMP deaminase, zinc-binding [Cryptosporidium felis]